MTAQQETMSHIMEVLRNALSEHIEVLTDKRFTGILSVRLDCGFHEGGLRNIKKNVSQEETIQRGQKP